MDMFEEEIREVEGKQLLILSQGYLLESQPGIALKHIANWEKLGLSNGRRKVLFFKILAYFPGGHRMLQFVRRIRRVFLHLK
jgi:hypothetical protein